MIADLTILPIGNGPHTSGLLGNLLKEIDRRNVRYQLTATGTCLEGTWDEIVAIARRCHDLARGECSHVVTLLKIEDDADDVGAENALSANIDSVERQAGQKFHATPNEAASAVD